MISSGSIPNSLAARRWSSVWSCRGSCVEIDLPSSENITVWRQSSVPLIVDEEKEEGDDELLSLLEAPSVGEVAAMS